MNTYILIIIAAIIFLAILYDNSLLTFKYHFFKTLTKRLSDNLTEDAKKEVDKIINEKNIFKLIKHGKNRN